MPRLSLMYIGVQDARRPCVDRAWCARAGCSVAAQAPKGARGQVFQYCEVVKSLVKPYAHAVSRSLAARSNHSPLESLRSQSS